MKKQPSIAMILLSNLTLNKLRNLLILMAFSAGAMAQESNPPLKRLDSKKTDGSLFIFSTSTELKYYTRINSREAQTFQSDSFDDLYFRTSNDEFTIRFAFYNPLQWRIKTRSLQVDDVTVKTYESFVESLTKVITTVYDPSDIIQPKTELNSAQTEALIDFAKAKKLKLNAINSFSESPTGEITTKAEVLNLKTMLLREWAYQIVQKPNYKKALNDSLNHHIEGIEQFIYGKVKLPSSNDRSVQEHIKMTIDTLYQAGTKQQFKDLLSFAQKIKKELVSASRKVTNSKSELISLIKSPNEIALDDAFKNYSQNTADFFNLTTEPLLEERNKSIQEFAAFLEKLNKDAVIADGYDCRTLHGVEFCVIESTSLKIPKKKDLQILISKRKITRDGKPGSDSLSTKFTIIQRKNAGPVPFLTTGVAAFPGGIISRSYNVVNDTIKEEFSSRKFQAAVFLNLYFNLGKEWYFVPQVGLSTAKDLPALVGGAGVAYGNRVCLTTGLSLLNWHQELKGKNIGDKIRGDELPDHISYSLARKHPFYISVSLRLGK